MINKFGLCLLLMISCELVAGVDVVNFSDETLRPRYQQLIQELRCPKCQNQNLADSNSPISVDLRRQIQRLLEEGKDNDEIKSYLSSRYSDFILYRPQVKENTWFLWAAPIVLLLLGLLILYRIFQCQKTTVLVEEPVSSQDQERLRELLKNTNGDSN
jgi:cytochrome c-type biogenesis protein CcmH